MVFISNLHFCRHAAWTSRIGPKDRWCIRKHTSPLAQPTNQTSQSLVPKVANGGTFITSADAHNDVDFAARSMNPGSGIYLEPQNGKDRSASLSAGLDSEGPFGLDQCKVCYIGIDPDSGGALAYISIHPEEEDLADATVDIVDAPVEVVELKTRKTTRRQIDPVGVTMLLEEIGSKRLGNPTCFLEKPICQPRNGSFSNHLSGINLGVWHGVLSANHINTCKVLAQRWKKDLNLFGKPKDGSRELAVELFPSMKPLLKRKKDHGRAEALLIAYWGMTIGRYQEKAATSTESDLSEKNVASPPPANKGRKFVVHGRVFDNGQQVVEAGLAENLCQVQYRVKSGAEKWNEWVFSS